MIELWVKIIFSKVNTRLIQGAMLLIDDERTGVLCDPSLIVGFKESCLYMGYYLQDELFNGKNYERVYIAATQNYYLSKGPEYYAQNGILNYLKWVDSKIKEEQDRANRYLEPHTLSKVSFFWNQFL